VNGERRSFALLRPTAARDGTPAVRDLLLEVHADAEPAATEAEPAAVG
jgi:hypothetical protein